MRDGLQEVDLNLQGRIRELAQDLGFRFDFQGHQIQDKHAQGTNILMDGAVLGHNKDVLAFQNLCCRQGIGDANWHKCSFMNNDTFVR